MNISQFIADCIKHRLQVLKINNSEFAEMAGVQPSVVTKWLSGKHNFTTDTLEKIQFVLKINFFSYTDEKTYCFPCVMNNQLQKSKP